MAEMRTRRGTDFIGSVAESSVGQRRLRAGIVVLALLFVTMVVIMGKGLKSYPEAHACFNNCQIKSPVLATELAGSAEELAAPFQQATNPGQSLGDADDPAVESAAKKPGASEADVRRWQQAAAVAAIRTNTLQDCFFIPTYAGFLLCTALFFAADARPRTVLKILGTAGAILAIVTALLDYTENVGILTATKSSAITAELARHISCPSRAKWACLGTELLLIGLTVWFSHLAHFRVWAKWLLAIGFAITGAALLVALGYLPLFEIATPSFGVLVVITGAGLLGPFLSRQSGELPEA